MTTKRKTPNKQVKSNIKSRKRVQTATSKTIENVEVFEEKFDPTKNLKNKTLVYDAVADKKKLNDWDREKDRQILEIMKTRATRTGSVSAFFCAHENKVTIITTDETTKDCLKKQEISQGRIIQVLRNQLCRYPANMQHPGHPRHPKIQKEEVSLGSLQENVRLEIASKGKVEIPHLGSIAVSVRSLSRETMIAMIVAAENNYFVLEENIACAKKHYLQSLLKCILVTSTFEQLQKTLNKIVNSSIRSVLEAEIVKWGKMHEVTEVNEPMRYDFASNAESSTESDI